MAAPSVAILFQALPPPVIEGVRKEAKPGGYSDSGADIAFTLSQRGYRVTTPNSSPSSREAMDWVFPDTAEGIQRAIEAGADTLWCNTVLFEGHPIERVMARVKIVGQAPVAMRAEGWSYGNLLDAMLAVACQESEATAGPSKARS